MKLVESVMALACGAMVMVSCSKSDDTFSQNGQQENKAQIYKAAFKAEFGSPASNQNWGFGSFAMAEVTVPAGSPDYVEDEMASASRRAVASSVERVTPQKYNNREELYANEVAKAYFFLRVDNKIVLQELNGVVGNNTNDYYPKQGMDLGNGVKDSQFNTDNEGGLILSEYRKLALIDNNNGITFASADKPISEAIFQNAPTFETMANHIPDAEKIKLAGSVEKFNSDNYKIFWYVAKWQSSDKVIHVDGILVPKNQITVNVPEYKKRIIVEDLKGNLTATSKDVSSDFDFNDLVFDAITWNRDGKNHLKIIVRAAGGQMPIYVAGKEVHEKIGYMFNTANPNYDYSYVLVEDSIIGQTASTFDFNSIPVQIVVNGVKTAAGSNIGQAPEKIAVGLDYKWCREKYCIKDVYPNFVKYVSNKEITNWWKTEE